MAITEKDQGEDKAAEDFHFTERRAVNNAYAALMGRQYSETQQAFTLEEALDAHIQSIESDDDALHPGALSRVKRIELNAAAAAIKALPPEAFALESSEEEDVNSAENIEERTAAKEAANEQAFGT